LSSFFFEYGIVKAKCEGSPMISKALYSNTPTEPELETIISPIVEQIIRELFEPGETMAMMSRGRIRSAVEDAACRGLRDGQRWLPASDEKPDRI
jgi:hypothetical protein